MGRNKFNRDYKSFVNKNNNKVVKSKFNSPINTISTVEKSMVDIVIPTGMVKKIKPSRPNVISSVTNKSNTRGTKINSKYNNTNKIAKDAKKANKKFQKKRLNRLYKEYKDKERYQQKLDKQWAKALEKESLRLEKERKKEIKNQYEELFNTKNQDIYKREDLYGFKQPKNDDYLNVNIDSKNIKTKGKEFLEAISISPKKNNSYTVKVDANMLGVSNKVDMKQLEKEALIQGLTDNITKINNKGINFNRAGEEEANAFRNRLLKMVGDKHYLITEKGNLTTNKKLYNEFNTNELKELYSQALRLQNSNKYSTPTAFRNFKSNQYEKARNAIKEVVGEETLKKMIAKGFKEEVMFNYMNKARSGGGMADYNREMAIREFSKMFFDEDSAEWGEMHNDIRRQLEANVRRQGFEVTSKKKGNYK